MKREIEADLLSWKNSHKHMPLLIRGARQVGKSFAVEEFAKSHFETGVIANFEFKAELKQCFTSLEPTEIIDKIELIMGQRIVPGKTLLFLDEIQECPEAIKALRYFKEKMPELHVIAAGSLLEFILNQANFRMPVGRVQSLYLKPLSFKEFLYAAEQEILIEHLQTATIEKPPNNIAHEQLLSWLQKYLIVGGMPEAVADYFVTQKLSASQLMHAVLMNTYRNDFGKYDSKTNIKVLQLFFNKALGIIAEQFKYTKIDKDIQSRDLKGALQDLIYAGLIYPVYSTAASGLPLNALTNEKFFKLLFVDVGLMQYANKLDSELISKRDMLLVNRGAVAEQYVGQELLALQPRYDEGELFYWFRDKRNSKAEVDYVIQIDGYIFPIEVKAGATGRLKSLQLFLKEKNLRFGIRISQHPLSFEDNVLSVPLYMIHELPRLVKQLI